MKNKQKHLKIISIIFITGIVLYFISEGMDFIQFFLLALVVGICFIIIGLRKKSKNGLPTVSEAKASHYQEMGMSEHEVTFFRETMATAKKQIRTLENNFNVVAKLKAINLRNDTLIAAKALFKELVKEPKKLHQADRFLYTHLPNIVDLTNKYLEIDHHELKNKQTYEILEESAKTIDDVSKLISQDYQRFVADDLEEMDIEISVAKQSLIRDNKIIEKNNFDSDTE